MTEFSNLGEFLKKHRVEAGMTQSELALALGGIHSQFVSNWERGLCAPPGHSFQALIKVLGIKREALLEVMVADARAGIKKRVYSKKAH